MKKKLVPFVCMICMTLSLFLTGCARDGINNEHIMGKWNGICDVTELFISQMFESDSEMLSYAKANIKDLKLNVKYTFDDQKVKMQVDANGMKQFASTLENGMSAMLKAMIVDLATEKGVTVEQLYASKNTDETTYISETLEKMGIDEMVNGFNDIFTDEGYYTVTDKTMTFSYANNTKETVSYTVYGDTLTIKFESEEGEFIFHCEKMK